MTSNRRNVFTPPPSSYDAVDLNLLPRLHRAVWKGQLQKVMRYLSEERNLDKLYKTDYYERTALHLASSCGYFNFINVLLVLDTRGINILDKDGRTSFFKAAQMLSLDCMEELHNNGAKIDLHDNALITPAEYLIVKHGDEGLACVQFIVKEVGVHQQNKDGVTLLHLAAFYGHLNIVRMLLNFKANVNFPDDGGRSPLMYAAQSNQFAIAEVLLEKGANIFAKDMDHKKALDHAIQPSRTCNILKAWEEDMLQSFNTTTNRVYVQPINNGSPSYEDIPVEISYSGEWENASRASSDASFGPDENVNKLNRLVHRLEEEHKTHVTALALETEKNKKLSWEREATSKSKMKSKKQNVEEASSAVRQSQGSLKGSVKSFFKRKYASNEEWAVCYDELVDQYDDLQRSYGKLLMVETEKEAELEEKFEELELKERQLCKHKAEVKALQKELKTLKRNTEELLLKKITLKDEINFLRKSIPKEKLKSTEICRSNELENNKNYSQLKSLQNAKEKKNEEIKSLETEEEMLRHTVGSQKAELRHVEEKRRKLVTKCGKLRETYQTLLDVD